MGTSPKYINPPLYAQPLQSQSKSNSDTHSHQRRLNSQPKPLVLPTPPTPNRRAPPTRQRAPPPRNMRHRPPNNNPIPSNALHVRTRSNRPRLLHRRLRRAHTLRLHAHRPINHPSARLPTAPRARRRQPLLPDRVYCRRSAAALLRGDCCCGGGVAFVVAGCRGQGRADVRFIAPSSYRYGALAADV